MCGSPSCCQRLSPQHAIVPSRLLAQAWRSPTANDSTAPSPSTARAQRLELCSRRQFPTLEAAFARATASLPRAGGEGGVHRSPDDLPRLRSGGVRRAPIARPTDRPAVASRRARTRDGHRVLEARDRHGRLAPTLPAADPAVAAERTKTEAGSRDGDGVDRYRDRPRCVQRPAHDFAPPRGAQPASRGRIDHEIGESPLHPLDDGDSFTIPAGDEPQRASAAMMAGDHELVDRQARRRNELRAEAAAVAPTSDLAPTRPRAGAEPVRSEVHGRARSRGGVDALRRVTPRLAAVRTRAEQAASDEPWQASANELPRAGDLRCSDGEDAPAYPTGGRRNTAPRSPPRFGLRCSP